MVCEEANGDTGDRDKEQKRERESERVGTRQSKETEGIAGGRKKARRREKKRNI